MRISFLSCGRRVIVGFVVVNLLFMVQPTGQTIPPNGNTEPADKVETYIRQLHRPEGKVKHPLRGFSVDPRGPVFDLSEPMKKLVESGNAIQGRLLPELKDPRIRNKVAIILAHVGDKDALLPLIELLPDKAKLTKDESITATCLLYALWQLTGVELGIHLKWSPAYTPEFRKKWLAWHRSNKDYLYTPSKPKPTMYRWSRDVVLVDFEAKMAGRPTAAYRKEHPWIAYEEIKTWRDDPAYHKKLKDYCFSVILDLRWNPHGHAPREAVRSLGRIRDARALSALHSLSTFAENFDECHDLLWTLEERGDPSSVPFHEKMQKLAVQQREADALEQRRLGMIVRNRLLKKYRDELKDKPFDAGQQINFIWCLESPEGVKALIAKLNDRKSDYWLPGYLRVAGYIDQQPVRACLKQMARDDSRDERARTMVHGALARLGEKESLEHLKRSLTHKKPGVRLAAAEGLWHLGSREGFRTLVNLLQLRPLEKNGEAVRGGKEAAAVGEKDEPNVEIVRTACKILGEMGDRSAIKPLEGVLSLNLNGFLAGGRSGTGWPGRPDAVALAKLGDFSGIAVLRASIRKGDPLDVVGNWGGPGDFVEIGLKRFIPELLPMFEQRDESKRVLAAESILLLLEQGR